MRVAASISTACGQLAQIVARQLQRELAIGGTDVRAQMYPGGASLRNRAFPAGSPRHKVVKTEMAKFMTAIRSEDHVAGGRSRD
jgi:hypothetical protein